MEHDRHDRKRLERDSVRALDQPDREGNHNRTKQQDDQRVHKLTEEFPPAGNLRRAPELIRTLAKQRGTRLGLLEAAPRIRAEAGDDAVGSFCVGGGHLQILGGLDATLSLLR